VRQIVKKFLNMMTSCPKIYVGKVFVIKIKKHITMITLFKDPFFTGLDNNRFLSTPETNIAKNETEYKVSICVPGLTKEDIKITTKEGILKISYEKIEGDKTRHFIGSFIKSYNIPDDVREKDILGKVENGVLELVLPIDRKKSLERQISLN
jgi:HSP20 family protein